MHGRVAMYRYNGNAQDLGRRAESGLLPIFKAQPGFKEYLVLEADGLIISFSAWDSVASADAANSLAAEWVAENMASELTLETARVGDILFSTALGVTSLAGS